MTAIKIVEKNDSFDVLVNDKCVITYSNEHPMESFIDLLDNLKRDLGYEISVDRLAEEKKYSDRAAKQIKQLGQIIGTMLVTKTCYEHDGIDTTAIDKNIEDLKKQMAQTVKIQRACMEREKNDN